MPIIPWKSFWDLEDAFNQEGSSLFRTPLVNISEEKDKIITDIEIPGAKKEDIGLEIEDNVLKIKAKTKKKEEKEGKGFYRKEISSGFYRRNIRLPVDVKDEEAEASYGKGVLTITIPKENPEENKEGRKLEVKTK